MSIDTTIGLINQGDFEAALNHQWNLIDSGDEKSRLELAHLFDEVGLHYFSQDQYLYLIENEPDFEFEAARGAVQNFVWLREYGSARELLEQFPDLRLDLKDYVESSETNFSTLNKDPIFIEDLVVAIFNDIEAVKIRFGSNLTLETLQAKSSMEEWLMNIAIDLRNNPTSSMGSMSFGLSSVGAIATQRPLRTVIGNDIDRARDILNTCAAAVVMLSNLPEFSLSGNAIFVEACAMGKKFANKFIWLSYSQDRDLSREESQAIENICWGLQRLGDASEGFASFVLASVTE